MYAYRTHSHMNDWGGALASLAEDFLQRYGTSDFCVGYYQLEGNTEYKRVQFFVSLASAIAFCKGRDSFAIVCREEQ